MVSVYTGMGERECIEWVGTRFTTHLTHHVVESKVIRHPPNYPNSVL